MNNERVYDIARLLFMTTNIRVIRRHRTIQMTERQEILFEGDLLNIPTNIQYLCIESIEAAEEDLMNLYVY